MEKMARLRELLFIASIALGGSVKRFSFVFEKRVIIVKYCIRKQRSELSSFRYDAI